MSPDDELQSRIVELRFERLLDGNLDQVRKRPAFGAPPEQGSNGQPDCPIARFQHRPSQHAVNYVSKTIPSASNIAPKTPRPTRLPSFASWSSAGGRERHFRSWRAVRPPVE